MKNYKVDWFDSISKGPTKFFNTEEEAVKYAETTPVQEKLFGGKMDNHYNFFVHQRIDGKWYVLKRIER